VVTATNGVAPGSKRKPLLLPEGNEPTPPRAPRRLGVVGRRWWKQIWNGGSRWLDPASDLLVVEMVCETQDRISDIEKDLDEHGRYYFTKSGQQLPRPGVADVRALRAQTVSWLSLLGFSPGARSIVGAKVESDNDALANFRKRKHDTQHNVAPL